MKIFVIGSRDHLAPPPERENFEHACRDIGKALASCNHEIIVCSDKPTTADYNVVCGTAQVENCPAIHVFRPDDDLPYKDFKGNHVTFLYPDCTGSWPLVHLHCIDIADVVLIIGGGEKSRHADQAAEILDTPVIAIPMFGGVAEDVWSKRKDKYLGLGLTSVDLGSLRRDWTEASAGTVVKIAERLVVSKNPGVLAPLALLSMSLVLVGLWVWIYFGEDLRAWTPMYKLVTLGLLAALLGTTLSNLTKQQNLRGRISLPLFITDSAAAIIVSFAMMLLLLVGAFVFQGGVTILISPDHYSRLAWTYSTLTFAGAAMLESTIPALTKRLKLFQDQNMQPTSNEK